MMKIFLTLISLSVSAYAQSAFAVDTFGISGDAAIELIEILDGTTIDTSIPWNRNGAPISCREQTFSDVPSIFHCELIGRIDSAAAGARPYGERNRLTGKMETRPSITFTGKAADVLVNEAQMHFIGKSNLIQCSQLEGGVQTGHSCTIYLIKNVTSLLIRPEGSDTTL